MLNIAETLNRWCREARPFALATVVDVRDYGTLGDGSADGLVAEEARALLRAGRTARVTSAAAETHAPNR